MNDFEKARELLREFKGDTYLFGNHVLKDIGSRVVRGGRRGALIHAEFPGMKDYLSTVRNSTEQAGAELTAQIAG
ncbi:MAG: hypothetical protein ACYS74_23110, partial [Planctomycetota bacterium]